MDEKGVSNNGYWRGKSDQLDKAMGWEGERKNQSGARGFIHGTYHNIVGSIKEMKGNQEGAKAEYKRAQEQADRAKNIGNTPPKK